MVLWFYGYMASLGPGPRLGFFGIFKTFLPTDPVPWWVSTQNFVGLYIITRAMYHKSLGDVPSMLMEICRIVSKRSPTPVPPPPPNGLNFSRFSGFSRLFCSPTLPLGEFRSETLCDCRASLGLSTMKVYVDEDMRIGRNELSCRLPACCCCCLLLAACCCC